MERMDGSTAKTLRALQPETHRVALLRGLGPGELLIHEIYRSIQGESTFAGLPCVFVRLAVCDSRCVWCDTPHAFNQGDWMPVEPRVHVIMDLKCPDSGECERNYWPNLERLKPSDQIKFVIATRRDFDWT